jgi:hypothetical protein
LLKLITASLLILPIALGQTALTTAQKTDGPSLKETLDWLKEKIPLAANHSVFTGVLFPKDVTVRTVPTHFDSCTVSFDYTEVEIFEKHRDRPIVTTTRQTVPLGAVSGTKVINDSVPLSLNDAHEIDKKVDRWIVSLDTTSKLVLSETHEDLSNTTTSESQNFAILVFYDESIANRVAAAFKHAADLCRKKEPF